MIYLSTLKESDMNTQTNDTNVAPAATDAKAAPPSLTTEVAQAVKLQATALSTADRSFETAILNVAEGVARIMGDETTCTHDHWNLVQAAFIAEYVASRGINADTGKPYCSEETARKRWVAVAAAMESHFALTKPAKPTKSAEVKAAQRSDAESKARALIEASEAKTPQDILALGQDADEVQTAPVIAALAKIAGEVAKDAGKAAADKAREEVKTLRENIRKGLLNISLAQLREVAELVASFQPAPKADEKADDADAKADATEGAAS